MREFSEVDSSVRKIIHKYEILSLSISALWNRDVSSYGWKQKTAAINDTERRLCFSRFAVSISFDERLSQGDRDTYPNQVIFQERLNFIAYVWNMP
jgi:hypothetical protein